MATEVADLPHLVVVDRVLGLPVVESALMKSAETYSRMKNWNQLMNWAFTTAETSLSVATKQAMPIAVPIAKKFVSPIHFVDHTLCRGLDKIEEKVPLVKEKPEKILHNAYVLAAQTLAPAVSNISYINDLIIEQATTMRNVSWKKANDILSTQYGDAAVKGVDFTTDYVDKLVDNYFPATGEEEEKIKVITVEEDKLLHIIQTIGHLSVKAAKRIYSNILNHLDGMKVMSTDYLRVYISKLVEFLHFTRCLQKANETAQTGNVCDEKANAEKEDDANDEKEYVNGMKKNN